MNIELQVYRYNPARTKPPRYDKFQLKAIGKDAKLLDLFEKIKAEQDSSFSYRKSCRHGICGSCAVKVDGRPVLACKFNVYEELAGRDEKVLVIDPLDREKVIRDLVVDMDRFWQKYAEAAPRLEGAAPREAHSPQTKIFPADDDLMKNADYCIQCGACYYVCPVVRVNRKYLGPAAFTKAYRFSADRRDFSARRLEIMGRAGYGVWDCAKCLLCVEACPKHIDPFEKITALHEMGTNRQIGLKTEHYRHAKVFKRQVRRTGYINEFFLALNTLRFKMTEMLLRGILLVLKGKMRFVFLFPRSIKRYELRDILSDKKRPRRQNGGGRASGINDRFGGEE